MHDASVTEREPLSGAGAEFRTTGTLVDRAISLLEGCPTTSEIITANVLGLKHTRSIIADRLAVALLGSDPRVTRLANGMWSLLAPARPTPIRDCTFAVVDVETTGSRSGNGDRITEIAIVAVNGRSHQVVLDTLVNPQRSIPARVTSITNITQADVSTQPTFHEIADDVARELAGRVFTAHNASFDWGFVSREIRRARDVSLDGHRICTARLARNLIPGLKSRSLDSLARYFGIEIERRHRAGGDAIAAAKLLIRLIELAEERGATSVEDLVGFRRSAGKRKRKRSAMPRSMEEI